MSDLPFGVERGFQEVEDNQFIVESQDDFKIGDLEDVDGVGPATARNLQDAGIQKPRDLYGLSQSEIAAVDGIGPKTAAKIRGQIAQRGNRIQNRGFGEDRIEKAREYHAERSDAERRTDESFNAETSLSYSQWRENPGQYDMPGVDTIPRERRLERTKEAAGVLSREGLVEDIEATPSGPRKSGVSGNATGTTARVKLAQDDPESTLAHELGHLADKAGGGRASLTNEIFGPNMGEAETEEQEQLREQGAKLASRRRESRFDPEWIEERAEKGNFGGGGFNEIFADAFAEAIEEPRRARKEAPELVRAIEDEFQEATDGFYTPF
jgi:DNA uptake protein ComE-like DNA-binding protein